MIGPGIETSKPGEALGLGLVGDPWTWLYGGSKVIPSPRMEHVWRYGEAPDGLVEVATFVGDYRCPTC